MFSYSKVMSKNENNKKSIFFIFTETSQWSHFSNLLSQNVGKSPKRNLFLTLFPKHSILRKVSKICKIKRSEKRNRILSKICEFFLNFECWNCRYCWMLFPKLRATYLQYIYYWKNINRSQNEKKQTFISIVQHERRAL